MRQADLTTVWVCTKQKSKQDGEMQEVFVNLRELCLNIQYLSDDLERETYGEVKNTEIILRSDQIPDVQKGDHLYFEKPAPKGTVEIDGEVVEHYSSGNYRITSIKPAYVGVARYKNPTITTAKAVT